MPPCWAQAHSVGRTKQATHSRPAHTGPGTPIPLAGQTTHHKWPALSCFMPTGEEHADECTLWLLGIKRERPGARPPSSRARERRPWRRLTTFFKRKKREERVPGLFYSKGRNGRRGCLGRFSQKEETRGEDAWTTPPKRLDYSTKKDWKGWRAALEGFLQGSGSKRAARPKTFPEPAQALRPNKCLWKSRALHRTSQRTASAHAGRCVGHRTAVRSTFFTFHLREA